MLYRVVLLMTVAALFCGSDAHADWRVEIESKTVEPNDVGVTLALSAHWDTPITALIVPVVVREIAPGSFWTGNLPYDTLGNGFYHPHVQGVTWNWIAPWATLIEEMRPGVPSGSCLVEGDVGYDGVSPDHFTVTAVGTQSTYPEPSGRVFMVITFDVNGNPGDFEFDTACFSNTVYTMVMVDNAFPPVDHGPAGTGEATFGKGIVTINSDCDCANHCDLDGNLFINPVDVVFAVNFVYRNLDARHVWTACPGFNADWNCDGMINPVDIVWYVAFVYKNSGIGPCDPCNCTQYPPLSPADCPSFP